MSDNTNTSADAAQIALLTEQLAEMRRTHEGILAARAAEEAAAAAPPESDAVRNLRQMLETLAQEMKAYTAPSITGNNFIAPIPAANGTSHTSLRSQFPDIEAAHITSIINHEFRASDLYKLDSQYRDKEASFAFNGATGQFETSNKPAKNYKDYNSLSIPLVAYFDILSYHVAPQRNVATFFFRFINHLQEIAHEYEWHAVLEYTVVFFNRRRMEMLENGDYSKWATADPALMTRHVFAHKKVTLKTSASKSASNGSSGGSRTQPASVCLNWNAGKCSGSAKCPGNRLHVCSTCGKAEHTALEHPKTN